MPILKVGNDMRLMTRMTRANIIIIYYYYYYYSDMAITLRY